MTEEGESCEKDFLLIETDKQNISKSRRTKGSQSRKSVFFVALFLSSGLVLFAIVKWPGTSVQDKYQLTSGSFEVRVEEGRLLGKMMEARNGKKYLGFLGVPYAKPPTGELRFMPPRDAEPWNGLRRATQFTPYCPQRNSSANPPSVDGSEDCLYLHIFTTNVALTSNSLPVMLYIHGGGRGYGTGQRYGPDYFMEEDVILIIMDYRTGPLGTLSLNIPEASGNQGLKDQAQALKWIRRNIQNFGGDPQRVTLFGNSGGAFQVSAHLLSPISKGLFQRAILQSGTAIFPGVLSASPQNDAMDLAILSNCSTVSTSEILSCLKTMTVQDLVLNALASPSEFAFTFSVDSASLPNDTFLPNFPLELLERGDLPDISIMIGITSSEALYDSLKIFTNPNHTLFQNDTQDFTKLLSEAFQFDLSASDPEAIAQEVIDFYWPHGLSPRNSEIFWNTTNAYSDRKYAHPMQVVMEKQLTVNGRRSSKSEIYAYYFSHRVDYSHEDDRKPLVNFNGVQNAPSHADELQFFFPLDYRFPEIPSEHKDANFSRELVRLWTQFADKGKPGHADNGQEWYPVTDKETFKVFELNENPSMIEFLPERMKFWEHFNLTDLYR